MDSSDRDISSFLAQTIHMPNQEMATEQPQAFEFEKRCCPGICKTHPCFHVLRRWKGSLRQHLHEREVKPGALLMFTSTVFPQAFTFLLGVELQRPAFQTFMSVSLQENEVQFELRDNVPVVYSDMEVLLKLLESGSCAANMQIDMEVWHLQAHAGSGRQLFATPDAQLCSFTFPKAPCAVMGSTWVIFAPDGIFAHIYTRALQLSGVVF